MGILTVLGVTAVGTAAWQVPIRGGTMRDRVNPAPRPGLVVGVRLHPHTTTTLGPTELDSILRDAPLPVESLALYRVPPPGRGEFVHAYRTVADRLGTGLRDWTHVEVSASAPAGVSDASSALLNYVIHRFGCLGIRSRPLSSEELAIHTSHTHRTDRETGATPVEQIGILRRKGGHRHLLRPAGWRGPGEGAVVKPVPEQVLGIAADGSPCRLTMSALPRMMVSGTPEDAVRLLSPALATGATVGVTTRRPGRFSLLRQRGALIVDPGGNTSCDVVLDDLGPRRSRTGGHRRHGAVDLIDPSFPLPPVHPMSGFCTVVTGAHTWTVAWDDGESTVIRPI